MGSSWYDVLKPEFEKAYFRKVRVIVVEYLSFVSYARSVEGVLSDGTQIVHNLSCE